MIKLCPVEDLAPGTVTRIATPDLPVPLALIKVGERIFCVDDTCSHETASLSDGWLDGHEIECPLHESRFDVRTGKPDCPPARRPIRTHDVEVVAGMVCVDEASVAVAREAAR
ncbi:bifunctional 3-phenylpropionate/cinnamic acid dioxygenase ferredoxin subunit [Streptomyces diastatochromogenes]|uniref:Rieske domain-containing protein n=1 Tax=Streptomyces diastatochromogenes TaxID=42236 RepID=A0A233SY48_STRDA|nr:bifunctional 3-phenylpropionate/cinnamic acid dioxygenase ferredoxin subunit [Streptomyces diastatochromogenes]MCZ0991708.1 bifunctional 3-phenylpropionate/cinnamic acid dioxygenase ferredoxin subunit [Streptomyces diastatochromogenes]OXZ00573.1 hypothetical protein BEK98_00460 [Streptomyces diastatochromogenes]